MSQADGIPYSLDEIRGVVAEHAMDPYHRELMAFALAEIEKLMSERAEYRHRLRFIWWHSFLANQTALDRVGAKLDDLRKQIIQEIKDATRGTFPEWWKNEPDTHDIAGLEP